MGILKDAPAATHRCEPPRDELRYADTGEPASLIPPAALIGIPDSNSHREIVYWPGPGMVWECDECHRVWVNRWVLGHDGRYISTCAHTEWQPETRRERKRRLRASGRSSSEG